MSDCNVFGIYLRDVWLNFTHGIADRSKACLKLGLIVLCSIHYASCENKEETARLHAMEKIRLQEVERARLKAEEQARLQAETEEASLQAEEEARLRNELEKLRESARRAAVGSKMDVLETMDGRSYRNVVIRKASAIGISIRHSSGVTRLPFENLPHAMRERFHYDPKEKDKALVREQKQQRANAKRFAAEEQSMREETNRGQLNLAQEKREKLRVNLAVMSARARQLESEVYAIRSELAADLGRTHRDYSHRRPVGVSRAPIIRERLDAKRQQLGAVRNREAAIRAELGR